MFGATFLSVALLFSANTIPHENGYVMQRDFDLVEVNEVWSDNSRSVYLIYYDYDEVENTYISQDEVKVLSYIKLENDNVAKWQLSLNKQYSVTETDDGLIIRYNEYVASIINGRWVPATENDWIDFQGMRFEGEYIQTLIQREIRAKQIIRRATWKRSSHYINQDIYKNAKRTELENPYQPLVDVFYEFYYGG